MVNTHDAFMNVRPMPLQPRTAKDPAARPVPASPAASAQAGNVVEIEDVCIDYSVGPGRRQKIRAVENVSISVRRGEKLVILGPSGCGKSTLLMALGGFLPISSGSIKVNGASVSKPSMERIMVFQDFQQLLPWFSVLENVKWGVRKRWPKLDPQEADRIARRQVELVGLSRQADQYPNTLSGGQKQRCAIARSFAAAPEILLMDEPFGALDAINRERMQQELNNIWSQQEVPTTIAFVTHDVNEAVFLGHRVMVMTSGPGRVRAVVDNPAVDRSSEDPDAANLAMHLRELLKEEA